MPPLALVKKRVALLAHGQVDHVHRHQDSSAAAASSPSSRNWPMCETSNSAADVAAVAVLGHDAGGVAAPACRSRRRAPSWRRVRGAARAAGCVAAAASADMAVLRGQVLKPGATDAARGACPRCPLYLRDCSRRRSAAACPFGGPARGGPLSSEERLHARSACQSFCLSVRAGVVPAPLRLRRPRRWRLSPDGASVAAQAPDNRRAHEQTIRARQ